MMTVTSVDEYIEENSKWKQLLDALRVILLKTQLTESVKWNSPVYTLNGKNVIGLGAFKNHASIWFFQGVFLNDKANKLINAQEGKTKALRQWRFECNTIKDVLLIEAYINEAIENQKLGKAIKVERNKQLVLPDLITEHFISDSKFKMTFEKLTKSKQREYAEYIQTAKKQITQQKRLEKIIPMVYNGLGLNDNYKNC
ncbi:MAG: YdeI/OmpD-associated family protein [Flavobacteriaceae bacterium]